MSTPKTSPYYALISSQTTDPFSTRLIHPQTGVSVWSFKGSEYQTGVPNIFEPVGMRGEHFLTSIQNQPLVHFIAFNGKKRLHFKSVVPGKISVLCTDPSGTFIFAGIEEKIYVWSVTTRELLNVFNAHFLKITVLKTSEDGAYVVSGSEDGSVAVFHIRDIVGLKFPGCEKVEPYHTYNPHNSAVSDLFITPGQQLRILSVSKQQNVVLFSLASKRSQIKLTIDYPITSCSMDMAESKIILGLNNGEIYNISLIAMPLQPDEIFDTSKSNGFVKLPVKHKAAVTKLSISFDGIYLVSGDIEGYYNIWHMPSKGCVQEGRFNGPIICAKFVRPWPSIFDENYSPPNLDHTQFQKQLRTNQMELPTIRDENADTLLNEKIDILLKNYLAKVIVDHRKPALTLATQNGENKMEVDAVPPAPASNSSSAEDKARIKELEKEVEKLTDANAELYEMCRELIVEDAEP